MNALAVFAALWPVWFLIAGAMSVDWGERGGM